MSWAPNGCDTAAGGLLQHVHDCYAYDLLILSDSSSKYILFVKMVMDAYRDSKVCRGVTCQGPELPPHAKLYHGWAASANEVI